MLKRVDCDGALMASVTSYGKSEKKLFSEDPSEESLTRTLDPLLYDLSKTAPSPVPYRSTT